MCYVISGLPGSDGSLIQDSISITDPQAYRRAVLLALREECNTVQVRAPYVSRRTMGNFGPLDDSRGASVGGTCPIQTRLCAVN